MAFKGITFAGQNVTPKNDGGLYQAHYGDGILWGCSMAISGDDLVIQSGEFIAGGRVCFVDGATNVDLSGRLNNTGYIQVIMNYDLSQGEGSQWYTTFVESATTTFPALTQDDINDTGTLYQLELAVVQISGGNLTNIYSSLGYSNVIALKGMDLLGDSSLSSSVGFRLYYDGDPYGQVSASKTNNDMRIIADQSQQGIYFEPTYVDVFGNSTPIRFRPNGAFNSTGQVEIDSSGQMRGGHPFVSTSGSSTVTVTTSGTTLGTLTACTGASLTQFSITFSNISQAQPIRITCGGVTEDQYLAQASTTRVIKGFTFCTATPSLVVQPLLGNVTVSGWSLYAIMF